MPAREVVPGDVMVLRAGDRIPADGRLVESIDLHVQEAALTGESAPVGKQIDALPNPDLGPADRTNIVFAGTAATYGRGLAVVVGTGSDSEFGKIAQLLQSVEAGRTPLQDNLDELGSALAKASLVVVAVIVALGVLRGQPFVEMLVFGIALAVAVVPEALPAVVTVSLALGVRRLVRRGALMRRLAAVETLGSTSVVCSDKTGTLTRDEMTVRKVWLAEGLFDLTGSGYVPEGELQREGTAVPVPEAARQLFEAAVLDCDAGLRTADGAWQIIGDPTEGALVVAAAKLGLEKSALDARCPRIHEIPFTSESKRMTTVHATGDDTIAFGKGAPEVVVRSCTRLLTPEGEVPLDDARQSEVLAAATGMADQALRVLAIARRAHASGEDATSDMTLLGLVGMIDPPREEAREAVATCMRAGIAVRMITGDHPTTAKAVARELGILREGRVVRGDELEAMDDATLVREVESIDVFARVSPEHKLRVVRALQERGHVVAMTGDGVNDAPALKKADIGVAMGITGTDVAKEAAAMNLTDDDFTSIVAAIEEGRGIFGNIRKYLMFLLSSNVGEIGLMAGASLLGLPLPLTAVQVLYVNLATDGLPALALAVDPPEPDLMERAPRDPRASIFTRPVVFLILLGGLWSTVVNLGLFTWATLRWGDETEAMTVTFVSLVLIQFAKAYSFRSDRHSVARRPFANRWLNLSIVWELGLLVAIVYLPVLHEPFGTVALPASDLALVAALSFSVLPVLELGKWMIRHGWVKP